MFIKNQIKNKNMLITGGLGFIGSALANKMSDTNQITVIDNLSSGRISNLEDKNKIRWINCDIRSDLSTIFEDIDIVFHEAANVFINSSIQNPASDADVNIMGTLNILENCRRKDVRRFVYASSCAVYGDPTALPIREDHPLNPKSPYAAAKLAGEYYTKIYNELYGLETVSLRYFNVYGKNQRSDSPYSGVIGIFTASIKENKTLTVYGDGEQTRDFIHVSDVVKANILAAVSKKAVGKAINIGTGKSTSINQIIQIIEEIVEKKPEVKYAQPRPGDIRHSLADIRLAEKIIDFKPTVILKNGLKELLGT